MLCKCKFVGMQVSLYIRDFLCVENRARIVYWIYSILAVFLKYQFELTTIYILQHALIFQITKSNVCMVYFRKKKFNIETLKAYI